MSEKIDNTLLQAGSVAGCVTAILGACPILNSESIQKTFSIEEDAASISQACASIIAKMQAWKVEYEEKLGGS